MLCRVLLSVVFLFSISFGESLTAQTVKDRAADRTVNEGNRRIDNKIDQGINRGFDAIEGAFKKKPKNTSGSEESTEIEENYGAQMEIMSKLFGGNAKFEPEYLFDMTYDVAMETKKGSKVESTGTYEMSLSKAADHFLMEIITVDGKRQEPRTRMIFDHNNKSMVSLVDDGKERTGMAIAFDPEAIATMVVEAAAEEEEITSGDMVMKRTGATKTINGYKCEQYTYTSPEATGEMWVTNAPELQGGFYGMFGYGRKKGNMFTGIPGYPQGFVMEMYSYDVKSKESASMRITGIHLARTEKVKTSDYQVMSLGGMMGQ